MRKRQLFDLTVIMLAIVVLCIMISGCGGGGSETVIDDSQQPSMDNPPQEASQAATEANLRTIDQAIQVYYMTEGEYPSNINDLVPKYLKKVPVEESGRTYCIIVDGDSAKAAVK